MSSWPGCTGEVGADCRAESRNAPSNGYEELQVVHHVLRVQHITDKHEAAHDGANHGLLRRVHDTCVLTACCVEAKKIDMRT